MSNKLPLAALTTEAKAKSSKKRLLMGSVLAISLALPAAAWADSIPSVVVDLENGQPSRGIFLTPIWIGIHDGTFDSYDGTLAG